MALRNKNDSASFQLFVKSSIFFIGNGRGSPIACDKILELRFLGAYYDAKFGNTRGHIHLKGILNHGLSPYRQEFLWGEGCQGPQACSQPGSRDHGFCDIFGHAIFPLFVFRIFFKNNTLA